MEQLEAVERADNEAQMQERDQRIQQLERSLMEAQAEAQKNENSRELLSQMYETGAIKVDADGSVNVIGNASEIDAQSEKME